MNFMSVERRIGLFLLVFVFSFVVANSAFAQEQRANARPVSGKCVSQALGPLGR